MPARLEREPLRNEILVVSANRQLAFRVVLLENVADNGGRLPEGEVVVLVVHKNRDPAVGVKLDGDGSRSRHDSGAAG